MIRYILTFLVGLMIGTIFPNQIRSVIYYGLSYIEISIKKLQESLSTPIEEKPYHSPFLQESYDKAKDNTQEIIQKLDPDWR